MIKTALITKCLTYGMIAMAFVLSVASCTEGAGSPEPTPTSAEPTEPANVDGGPTPEPQFDPIDTGDWQTVHRQLPADEYNCLLSSLNEARARELFDRTGEATVEELYAIANCLSKDAVYRMALSEIQDRYRLSPETADCVAGGFELLDDANVIRFYRIVVLDPGALAQIDEEAWSREAMINQWATYLCFNKDEWTNYFSIVLDLEDIGLDVLRCFLDELGPEEFNGLLMSLNIIAPPELTPKLVIAAQICELDLEAMLGELYQPPLTVPVTPTPTPTVVELPASPEPDVAAGTPELLWRYETGGVVNSSPAVVDDLVYVSSEDGYVYGLDALTGWALWGTDIGEQGLSSPTVAEGVVYFSFAEGYVVALDALTGEVQWGSEAGDKGLSPPALANGVVYVGSNDGYVYALDANSGQSVWRQQTGQVWASPVVVGGVIYIGSVDDHIYALDVANGELLWRYEAGGMIMSSPAVVNGVVYVGSADHHIYAVDAADGDLLWRHPTGDQVWSSPAVEDGMVYVGSSDEHLYALDANTGQLVWQYWAGDAVYSSPAVEDGVVYVGSYDDHVYALDAKTGQLVWRYKTGGQVSSSPAVAEGVVYIGSDDGYVYALTLQGFRKKSREGSGGPYSWSTGSVEFAADSFVITIGDREFQPVLSTLEINGYWGDEGSSTLELTWFDNGVEMRVNVYFEADAMTWWSDEVRTYDGQPNGDWVYHYHERLFDQPLGSAFQGDIILQGVTRSGEIAKLAISGARVKAFSYYNEGAGLEDSLIGLLMALGNTLGRSYGPGNLDAIDVAGIHEEDISGEWTCVDLIPVAQFLERHAPWPIHEAPQSFMDGIGRIPTWEVEVSDGTGRVVSTLGPGFEIFQGSFVLEDNYWRLVPDFIEGCSRR